MSKNTHLLLVNAKAPPPIVGDFYPSGLLALSQNNCHYHMLNLRYHVVDHKRRG